MIRKLFLAIAVLSVFTVATACLPAKTEDGTIKIGCVLSTSGLQGSTGEDLLGAARIAIAEINDNGGVLGKQLQLVEEDDATDASKCLERIEKLVSKDGVQVLIGGMTSGAVITSGPYLAEQEVLMVSPSATATEISDEAWTSWVFRTATSDALQGRLLAKIILENDFTRLATIVQNSPYGVGLESELDMALQRAAWKGNHILAVHFDPNQDNYNREVQNIQFSHPDVVLAVTYVEDGIKIFSRALFVGLDGTAWLGCDGNYGDHLFVDSKCAEFMSKAIISGTRFVSPQDTEYDKFAAAYKASLGRDPNVYCDTTYDAVKMIAKAIEKAGTYDAKAIRSALREIGQSYRGASGTITFDVKGDRVSGIYEIWKVEKDPTAKSGYKNVRIKLISIG